MSRKQLHRSSWAVAHAEAQRRIRNGKAPSWDDIAAAYDSGICHALGKMNVGQRRKLDTYMHALRVMNAQMFWSEENP
jgi:hypothetical protein